MRPIRVLVVDDSVVVRRLVSAAMEADPVLEVAGVAANGKIALAKIPQLSPDVVVLDVDMPVLGGLETLAEIRRRHPSLRVIMFSALTERGADATLEALFRGALDYVTKPANLGSAERAARVVREELIPKIKVLCHDLVGLEPPQVAVGPALEAPPVGVPVRARRVEVLVVGASTGGPQALEAILTRLPPPLPVPVLIVQHMPPLFTHSLAQQLSHKSGHRVSEAWPGAPIQRGEVLIAPGGLHLEVERTADELRARITDEPPENSCRPAVDVLFRTAADVFAGGTLAVVLTGMGRDGLRGCEAVRRRGGQVVVQDRATSVVWGMPGFVAGAGLAEAVVPLAELPALLATRLGLSAGTLAAHGEVGSGGTTGHEVER